MTETPARLTGLSAAQVSALVALHLHGEAERQRNNFVHIEQGERAQVATVIALTKRGLAVMFFRSGRHRARLTESGQWYARSAIARWQSVLAA